MKSLSIMLVGDVVTAPLLRAGAGLSDFDVAIEHADIDQHLQLLLSPTETDVLVCHAAADYFLGRGAPADVRAWTEQYCAAVDAFAGRQKGVVVLNTISPPVGRLVGRDHVEALRLTAWVNERLFACADASSFVSIADIAGVLAQVGLSRAVNLQNLMVMSLPYTGHVLPAISQEYVRVIRERFAPRKKVVVLDADNTLWAGIVGEDGLTGIQAGDQFPGLVHRRFQQQLLDLRASGIVLALASKNNEADVRDAFDTLDMPLKWEHFSARRVNWAPKSQNIAEMAAELNLGLDSFVFIDDNPFELEEVGSALPAVRGYRFEGRKPQEALSLLSSIADLGAWAVTSEDLTKARLYAEENERQALKSTAGSLEDYLKSLDIRLEVGRNRADQAARISQLTNKTNQFNLTTRRYSESDIRALMQRADVFDFRVVDKFGDMGVVGVVIVADGEIDTFLMSCRALGRRVEETMLRHVCEVVSTPLRASYVRTAKNGMVADFYDRNGFIQAAGDDDVKHYAYSGEGDERPMIKTTEVSA